MNSRLEHALDMIALAAHHLKSRHERGQPVAVHENAIVAIEDHLWAIIDDLHLMENKADAD